jgi:membrane protease YdiL (CAAX protease family)
MVRALFVYFCISVGTTTGVAIVTAVMGWTVTSPAWSALVPIAMWAPALAAYVARRVEHPRFTERMSLRRWGTTGAQVVVIPLVMPFAVYGASYGIAASAGFAYWNPGDGRWTSTSQILANVVVNLTILGIFGTFTAMGEEIGWRGYLQPRLDAAGIRSSVIVVWLFQVAYHAPLMVGAGYVAIGSLGTSLLLFAIGDLPISFLLAREAYRARSLWPAVFFHSFHNTISQWLYPRFFTVSADQPWLQGEAGILPMVGYVVLGAAIYLWMRLRGQTWETLSRQALSSDPHGAKDSSRRPAATTSG